jgi:hypothetical protein
MQTDAVYQLQHNLMKIELSDSSNNKSPVCNGTKRLAATTKHVGTPRTNIGKKLGADLAIPKWKQLKSKQLALCQQHVQLEWRLYEFSGKFLKTVQCTRIPAAGKWTEDYTITNCESEINPKEKRAWCFLTDKSMNDMQMLVSAMGRELMCGQVVRFTLGW